MLFCKTLVSDLIPSSGAKKNVLYQGTCGMWDCEEYIGIKPDIYETSDFELNCYLVAFYGK